MVRIDLDTDNTSWQDSAKKEVGVLGFHQCFGFKPPNYKPSKEYHFFRLHQMYDINFDFTYKARLVCDGS